MRCIPKHCEHIYKLQCFTSVTLIFHASVFESWGKGLAERGFDPRTSGLWAQHASTAPLCF